MVFPYRVKRKQTKQIKQHNIIIRGGNFCMNSTTLIGIVIAMQIVMAIIVAIYLAKKFAKAPTINLVQ